jgi:hypothetical protein
VRSQRPTGFTATLAAVLLAASCAGKLEKPPIEITYRESFLGAGKILRLKNQTNQPLLELKVTIRSATGEVTYEEAELPGYEVLEVGWKKLGGFQVPDGAEVEVRAQGYLLPVSAELSEAAGSGESTED